MTRAFSNLLIYAFVVMISTAEGATKVKLVQFSGEVKVRRGLEEKWERANIDMLLEEIDTILTGENGEAVLEFGEGATFRLGGNSVLDIADLRKITEQELFMILMSRKIRKIKPNGDKAPARTGDVSTIRGEPYVTQEEKSVSSSEWRRWEVNAAQALSAQNLLTNAALKWHRIKEKFPGQPDCGEASFYLAQTFEQLRQTGQARDEYQLSVEQAHEQNCEDGETKRRVEIARRELERQN
ncbi:MAG: hypothetical protein ACREOO_09950 [bacterium]